MFFILRVTTLTLRFRAEFSACFVSEKQQQQSLPVSLRCALYSVPLPHCLSTGAVPSPREPVWKQFCYTWSTTSNSRLIVYALRWTLYDVLCWKYIFLSLNQLALSRWYNLHETARRIRISVTSIRDVYPLSNFWAEFQPCSVPTLQRECSPGYLYFSSHLTI
jgi:hypothetical protein